MICLRSKEGVEVGGGGAGEGGGGWGGGGSVIRLEGRGP